MKMILIVLSALVIVSEISFSSQNYSYLQKQLTALSIATDNAISFIEVHWSNPADIDEEHIITLAGDNVMVDSGESSWNKLKHLRL